MITTLRQIVSASPNQEHEIDGVCSMHV